MKANERWSDYPDSIVDLRAENARSREALTLFRSGRKEVEEAVERKAGLRMPWVDA